MDKTNSLTIDDLYEELAELAREEATTARDVWNDLVEEVVEGHVDLGELDPDQDIEGTLSLLEGEVCHGDRSIMVRNHLLDEVFVDCSSYLSISINSLI
jgi:hypothetical protein